MNNEVSIEIIDNILFSEIKPSIIHGKGLFSQRFITKNSILGILDGQYLSYSPFFLKAFEWNAIEENLLLIRPFRTKYGFINHNRAPNLILKQNPLVIIALRDIQENEEMTLDYRKEPLPKSYIQGYGVNFL
jgi:uncharacterized protein